EIHPASDRPGRTTARRTQEVSGISKPLLKQAYVDTSAVLAGVLKQSGGEAAARLIESFDAVYSSNLLEAELRSVFAREGILASKLEPTLAGFRWVLPDRPLGDEMARVVRSGSLRGADLWHVACALFLAEEPG